MASQIILHPYVSDSLKVAATTGGSCIQTQRISFQALGRSDMLTSCICLAVPCCIQCSRSGQGALLPTALLRRRPVACTHTYIIDPFSCTCTTRQQVYRSVQYAARFLAWHYARQGYSKEVVAQMSAIKSALGTTRKGMRRFERLGMADFLTSVGAD